jgi:hypothetical protein
LAERNFTPCRAHGASLVRLPTASLLRLPRKPRRIPLAVSLQNYTNYQRTKEGWSISAGKRWQAADQGRRILDS